MFLLLLRFGISFRSAVLNCDGAVSIGDCGFEWDLRTKNGCNDAQMVKEADGMKGKMKSDKSHTFNNGGIHLDPSIGKDTTLKAHLNSERMVV